ncbi:MAG: hypothetical protein L0216_01310 [Planctomycetales bacterium]|nr:hypothetical protein [Planctomycetales bacterium]
MTGVRAAVLATFLPFALGCAAAAPPPDPAVRLLLEPQAGRRAAAPAEAAPRAEEGRGPSTGGVPADPIPEGRNNTFSALFWFPTMEGAGTLPSGVFETRLGFEQNKGTLEKEGTNPVPNPSGTYFRYRGNRFYEGELRLAFGIASGFEARAGITLVNLREGSTDIILNRDGHADVAQVDRNYNIGRLTLGLKGAYGYGGTSEPWNAFGAGLDFSVPIGDPDDFANSGTMDLALALRFTHRVAGKENPVLFHANLGLLFPIGEDDYFEHPSVAVVAAPVPAEPSEIKAQFAFYGGLGLAVRLAPWLAILGQLQFNSSPYTGEGVLEDMAATGHLGFRAMISGVIVSGSIGSGMYLGQDSSLVTANLHVAYRFGKGGAAPGAGGERPGGPIR